MVDERFPARSRLSHNRDYQRVFRGKKSAADGVLVVYACPNQLPQSRLGLTVSKKVGGAVRRNRWKRQIREVFRRHRQSLPSGFDFVVLPRAQASPDHTLVAKSLPKLMRAAARRARGPSARRSDDPAKPQPPEAAL